jgi:hypothetical protein
MDMKIKIIWLLFCGFLTYLIAWYCSKEVPDVGIEGLKQNFQIEIIMPMDFNNQHNDILEK